MEANGLKFWMLADDRHWTGLAGLHYERRTLRLASQRPVPVWPASEPQAKTLLESVPGSVDEFGMRAFLSQQGVVFAVGVTSHPVPIFKPAAGEAITDIVIGYDGLLYLAVSGGITVVDLRGRVEPVKVKFPDLHEFQAWRLAAIPAGGVWALDKIGNQIGRVAGSPLFVQPHPPYSPNTVRPCEENPDPPRLLLEDRATWPASETPVCIACSPEGRLALLTWNGTASARLRILSPKGIFDRVVDLSGSLRPYTLTWVSTSQVAVVLPGMGEALVYPLDETGDSTPPAGDVYPLRDHDGGPFLHGVTLPPNYPTSTGCAPLARLSLPSYAPLGSARNATTMDSGNPSTVWHRLYLEASIPDRCGVVVHLGAVNEKDDTPTQWFPHRFGRAFATDGVIPIGAWVPSESEVAFCHPMLECPRDPGRSGLFTVLIQRTGLTTRALRGRYLKLRIELMGDGRSTPEVAAARVYASRFSYIEHYLPELYRENVFPPDSDRPAGQSTPADFLERFLGNFEGILTPLEDKIADSYLVTRAESAPEEALEWLGSWIGVTFDSAFTTGQRRRLLSSAPELFRQRGTLRGLGLALDIATQGAVSRGQIVILEDFRLRRTFATILGANLTDEDDPLLAGMSVSGNSFVGDTLFLGDEHRKEFLALFSADLQKTAQEQAAVDAFFDSFAYRVTVLVHQEVNPQDLGLIRRIVNLETPAHVLARVERASNAFLAGMASLVGIDTYLAPKRPRQQARVNVSYLGQDYIEGTPSLDPRLGGSAEPSGPPVASLIAPPLKQPGESFMLDASGSTAPQGSTIVTYVWTLLK